MTVSVPPFDPVIEAYKRHVDVSLLLENLRRTPDERVRAMISMLELSEQLQQGVRAARAPEEDRSSR